MLAAGLLLAALDARGETSDALGGIAGGIEPIVHLRTYYWDSQSTSGEKSVAWALGGWAGLKTPWYGDALQLSVVGYTSQKLYGPSDEGGSQLLQPNQNPITVLGEAYASLRFAGQTFTGYRQSIDQPWVNPEVSRMIPNLFEGYLVTGRIAEIDYIAGYVTKIKLRDSNTFEWMSSAAGSSGPQQGMTLLGARHSFAGGAEIRIAEQYLADGYNTFYVDGGYPVSLGSGERLRFGGQYAYQQSVGSEGLGSFNTWMYGLTGVYEPGPLAFQLAWTQTSRNQATQSPFGQNPSYLYMMQVAFNDAGEQGWLAGVTLDFRDSGFPGLQAVAQYGNGHAAIKPSTGASLGNQNETDVKLRYDFDPSAKLRGLSFGIEGSWLNQAGATAQGRQLRVYANYEIPLR